MRYLCEASPFTLIKNMISEKWIKKIIRCLWFKFRYWLDFYLRCWWHINKRDRLTDFYTWRISWWAYETKASDKQTLWWSIFYFEPNYLEYQIFTAKLLLPLLLKHVFWQWYINLQLLCLKLPHASHLMHNYGFCINWKAYANFKHNKKLFLFILINYDEFIT